MTREQFARKIRWSLIIWTFGWVNVTAMIPQLIKVIRTHETADLSLTMFWIYLSTQVAFSLNGFIKRDRVLFVTLGLSALINLSTIATVLYFRYL